MSKSIHGHQVMEMMGTAGRAYKKSQLKLEMCRLFSEQARYHTCMQSDLTADDLIDFFISKGKFIESENGIKLAQFQVC